MATITYKFNSEKELENWKREITQKAITEKNETIKDIISFCIENPEKVRILEYYPQIGGNIKEYLSNYL